MISFIHKMLMACDDSYPLFLNVQQHLVEIIPIHIQYLMIPIHYLLVDEGGQPFG